MKLEFGTKSVEYLNGEPYKTRVLLVNDDGAMYPVYFEPEAVNKSNSELFKLALESIYEDNFPGRAEKEKFELLDQVIAEARKETQKNRDMLKTVSLSFTQIVEVLEEKGVLSTTEETTETEVVEHETTVND